MAITIDFPSGAGGTFAGGTLTSQLVQSTNGAASTPPVLLSGTIFTGGSATTTKPALLIEPSGTTSNNWDTNGTLIGANAPSGFTGSVLSAQINAANVFDAKSSRVSFFSGSNICYFEPTTNGIIIGNNAGYAIRYNYGAGIDTTTLSSWATNSGTAILKGPDGSGAADRRGYSLELKPGDNLGTAAVATVSLWSSPQGAVSGFTSVPAIKVIEAKAASSTRGELYINNGPLWTSGTGSPEGAIAAPIGSFYSRTDGGASTSFYVKESGTGNTGWVAK